MAGNRIYLLDTNVLLHDPDSIFSFKSAQVGIPIMVLEELDSFKGESIERGYNARQAIRHLDALRATGSLREGVPLDNGGTLKVFFVPDTEKIEFPLSMNLNLADNIILLTALDLKNRGYDVQFISKDLNARVKADTLGISAQDYLKGQVSPERFFQGWVQIEVPAISLKKAMPPELEELEKDRGMTLNEFALLSSRSNPYNYKLYRYTPKRIFKEVLPPKFEWPLGARNAQQAMALDLLLDEEIPLVSLIGTAGTGKTFMALLAGLQQVLIQDIYEKILISRPVIPLGPDIGYLPGTIEEKLHSWMQPIYDNMEFILHSVNGGRRNVSAYEEMYSRRRGGVRPKKGRRDERKMDPLDELIKKRKISLEAITYMRGRSIPYQFILIDEVQNLTPHEVKTLISRVGEGSKIILAGDPYQIDSPYLDFSSNGLIVANSKFKGQPLFGTVFLETSERSELSRMVSEVW
ncbi:MAG: PhoH family protein [Candidatus Babeliales bacterium]